MMGMGSEKKIGSMLLALSGGLKPEKKADPYSELIVLQAERVLEAIKSGDAQMFIKELPRLLNVLPSAEMSDEYEDMGEEGEG